MSTHRGLRESLGAYVLGALEPDERRDVEGHLADCSSCRDEVARLTALPPLLDRLEAEEAADGRLVPPPTLGPRVAAAALADRDRLHRQMRWWRAGALAAAAAAVVAVAAWAPWDTGPTFDRWVLEPTTATAGVDGTAAALAWEWGTTVELDLQDLPAADRYVVWAVSEDGRREQAGTWGRTASGDARVRGASAIQRDRLARIDVEASDGQTLAVFEVTGPESPGG